MRICFVGDSFINGTADDEALGWVGRIVTKARNQGRDVTYYNLGIRRDTSTDIAARWRAEVERRLPAIYQPEGLLAFSFGTNDCADNGGAPRVPFDQAIANTEAILSDAAAFAPTIMIGPAPAFDNDAVDRRTNALSEAQKDLCAKIGIPYLAIFDFVAASEPWRQDTRRGDGTHPNKAGYAALADFIWQWPALHRWFDQRK
jgi:acyl-CoA thioesterase I